MIHSKMMETTKKRGSTSFENKEEDLVGQDCQTVEMARLSRCSSESGRALVELIAAKSRPIPPSSSSSSSCGNKQLITE